MPALKIKTGSSEGKIVELHGNLITVGRNSENGLQLDDGTVSSFHATLTKDDGDYVLTDQQTRNGTFVNGQQITEKRLRHGDELLLGGIMLLYESNTEPTMQGATARPDINRFTGRRAKETLI